MTVVSLFAIDTAAVNEVDIYPHKDGGKEIRLRRGNAGWQIEQGTIKAIPENASVGSMLGALLHPVVQRTVTTNKSK